MNTYNILDFGAIPDEMTINTASIQKALSSCHPGDKVVIPRGIFISGALFINGGTKLVLEPGAVLKGSSRIEDYPLYTYRFEGIEQTCYASLINVPEGQHQDIEISGSGTIDGSGIELYKNEMKEKDICRGRVICIRNTTDCLIEGITICDSVSWTLHFIYCTNVTVRNVKIFARHAFDFWASNQRLKNGDGITLDSCVNGEIADCIIDSQDDCISIKSGKNEEGRKIGKPSSNIHIHNNTIIGGSGVSIGSEMSGGIKDILVENCLFTNVISLLNIKCNKERGGFIENIRINECRLLNYNEIRHSLSHYNGCIYIDAYYKTQESNWIEEGIPTIKNITFQDIYIMNNLGNPVYIKGISESPIENISFINVESFAMGEFEIANANTYFENVFHNGLEVTGKNNDFKK